MAYWSDNSLKFAPQSAFGTAATTGFEAVQCEKPSITFATEITELELLTGQVGAAPERLIGRRSGTLTFKVPLEGFKSGYDATAENPGDTGVIPRWLALFGNVIGSANGSIVSAATQWAGAHLANSNYDAGGVLSATASAITADAASDITTDADIRSGELVVTALTPTSTSVQMGFAKSLVGAVLSLFEASKATVNSTDADFYGTSTAWLSTLHASQVPQTVRWTGQDTTFCYILQDVICEGITVTWDSGAVPTAEFRCRFYDYSMDKTAGGLEVPDAFLRVPQIVGAYNGQATLGTNAACGLASATLEFTQDIVEVNCHGAQQGITSIAYRNPRVRASVSVLHNSTDLVYDAAGSAGNTGSHTWQAQLEQGVSTSLGCYVGAKPGRCFAFLIPAAKLVEVPAIEDRDGSVAYKLTYEAVAYSGDSVVQAGDTVANSPINSLLRVGIG
jgi:hypothetical protein